MRRLDPRGFKVSTAGLSAALTPGQAGGPLATFASGAVALASAIVVTSIGLVLLGADPFEAFDAMIQGSLGSRTALTQTLVVTTPLILTGLAAAVPFSARIFNVGAEGQLAAGAVAATAIAFWFASAPAWLIVILAILAGIAGGAIWGLFAGALRAYAQANEVIVTLMLNFVGLLLASYAITGAWADPAAPTTRAFPDGVRLPIVWPETLVNLGILLAVVAAVVAAVVMARTKLGFGIRATGFNEDAARLGGFEIRATVMAVLVMGGAFAGLAGAIEVIGKHQALVPNVSANYGFVGIAVALVARLSPLWVVPSAFFFAAISVGANALPATAGISTAASLVVLGVFVLALLAMRLIRISYPEVR
jgi:simple sugar transport system permease protein